MKQIETWFVNQRRRSSIAEVKDLKAPQHVNLNHEYVQSLSSMEDHHGHSLRINNHLATCPSPTLVLKQRGTLQHQAHSELVSTGGSYPTINAYCHDHDLHASESTPPDDPWSASSPLSHELVSTDGSYPTINAYCHDHGLYTSESTPPDDPWSEASPVSQSHSSHSSSHVNLHQTIPNAADTSAIGLTVSDYSAATSQGILAPQHLGQNLSSQDQSAWGHLRGNGQTQQETFHPVDPEGCAWDMPCVCQSARGECAGAAVQVAFGTPRGELPEFTELPEGQPDLQQRACSAMFEAAHAAVGLAMCATHGIHSFSSEFGPSPPSQDTFSPGGCTFSQWKPAFSTCSRTVPHNIGPGSGTNQHHHGSWGWVADPGICQEALNELTFMNDLNRPGARLPSCSHHILPNFRFT